MPRNNKPTTKTKARMRWEFDPAIPTHDFFESVCLDDLSWLQEAVECFVSWVEEDRFLIWEAVVCKEQGVPLTRQQEELLEDLLNFNDEGDDQILYIDELPRPSEAWHVILDRLAPYLLIEPFRTSDCQDGARCEGWLQLSTVL